MELGVVIKPKRLDRYTVIPLSILRQSNLTMAATGLFTWLYSHEAGRQMTLEFMEWHFKDGKDAIRSRLSELETAGFLIRHKKRIGSRFVYDYELNDSPKMVVGKSDLGKSDVGISASENPTQSNNKINKISNKINKIKEKKIFPEIVLNAFDHIKAQFPARYQPSTESQKDKWLDTIEKLNRINGVSPRKLYLLIKEIRKDDFWRENLLSVNKLRQRNKQGVLWIDVFMERYGKEFENLDL